MLAQATSSCGTNEPAVMRYTNRPSEGVQYTVTCETQHDLDWSLAQLKGTDPRAVREYKLRLGKRLKGLGARKVYGPTAAAMSGTIVSPQKLNTPIYLGNGVVLWRNTDLACDGVYVAKGEGVIITAAGCGFLVATHPNGTVFMAHVGRFSTVDPNVIVGKPATRADRSIVNSVARRARKAGLDPKDMTLRLFFQIDPADFKHPLDHEKHEIRLKNRAMRNFVDRQYGEGVMPVIDGVLCFDLGCIVERQAHLEGFGTITTRGHVLPRNSDFRSTRDPDASKRDLRHLIVGYVHPD